MKSFKSFISENSSNEITVTWGRCNPPTIGHGKLFDAAEKASKNKNYRIYVTHTQNKKKDPLNYVTKVKYIRKMFPKHARKVMLDESTKTIFDLMTLLYNQGYRKVNLVAGSDQVEGYRETIGKYNGVKSRHGLYDFEVFNVVSAGQHDPDAEGAAGMSATKLRKAAADNDFLTFMKGVPPDFEEAKNLFNEVRKGLGLNESHFFRKHIELETISEERESFVSGDLFKVGEIVIIKETCETATISRLGTNYLVLTDKNNNNNTSRKWIHQVEKLNTANESTIEDRIRDQAERKKEKDAERLERDLERAREADKREAELEAEREAERKEREKEEQEKRQQRRESIRSILKLMR